jgi:hypothetical protein
LISNTFMSFRTYVRNLYSCTTRFLPLVEVAKTPNDRELQNMSKIYAEL